jgi:hypothetical protein
MTNAVAEITQAMSPEFSATYITRNLNAAKAQSILL